MMAEHTMPAIGDPAPGIDAETSTGEHFSLDGERGRWVAVYFYPRANTPG